jgi:WD40 repeat protein
MVHRLKLHKVLIQSLSFSQDEKYLASLGGQDDNTLVIWDVSKPSPAFHPPTVKEDVF